MLFLANDWLHGRPTRRWPRRRSPKVYDKQWCRHGKWAAWGAPAIEQREQTLLPRPQLTLAMPHAHPSRWSNVSTRDPVSLRKIMGVVGMDFRFAASRLNAAAFDGTFHAEAFGPACLQYRGPGKNDAFVSGTVRHHCTIISTNNSIISTTPLTTRASAEGLGVELTDPGAFTPGR